MRMVALRPSSRCLCVIPLLAAATAGDPWSSDASTDSVLHLTASNFEPTVFHSGKNGIVKFYQSWCAHSIRFKPTWDQIAEEAHPSIFVANVNCGASKENEICRKAGITTYPTIQYYVEGTEYDYTGSLSIDALREFIGSTLIEQCNPMMVNPDNCSDKQIKYVNKWLARDLAKMSGEIQRLESMMQKSGDATTAELRRWMRERRDLLKLMKEGRINDMETHDEL